jgi:hypothetical protein
MEDVQALNAKGDLKIPNWPRQMNLVQQVLFKVLRLTRTLLSWAESTLVVTVPDTA